LREDLPPVLLLPGAGRYPFNGVFDLSSSAEGCVLRVTGRVAHSTPPEQTWPVVLRVHEALRGVGDSDRLLTVRSVWDRVLTLPRQALGPAQGQDLSLLVFARDGEGTSLAAVGLQMIWRWSEERLVPLVPRGHPLLASPGVPRLPPGALTLDAAPAGPLVAACSSPREVPAPAPAEVLRRCGFSP